MKQYDAIIIGFGKAGKTLAAELSNLYTNQNFDSRIRNFHPALSQ